MATDIIKKIRDVLIAFEMHQKGGLKDLCYVAFYDVPEIRSNLDFSGVPEGYVTDLIRVLSRYGQLASEEHALVKLLKDVQEKVGIDNKDRIAALIEEYLQHHPDYGKEEPREVGPNPYRGLKAFREEDADNFFGRDTVIEKLHEAVKSEAFVAVLGPSGSGKSSVVCAGLIPRLRKQGDWLITSFRPGGSPFSALSTAVMSCLEPNLRESDRIVESKGLADKFTSGKVTLMDIVYSITQKHPESRLLLFADQFEELYTLCDNDKKRRQFLDQLLDVFDMRGFVCLLAMRADFLGKALSYRPLADALQDSGIVIGPMNREELQAVIKKPANALNVYFEDGLTDRVLDAVGKEPGNLPLLEFALTELWEKQITGTLTHVAYAEVGGVEQALACHAEDVYKHLVNKPDEQTRVQRIFTQLVLPGEGTEDTRRVATRQDIGEASWNLVTQLADKRLIVTGCNEETGEETVELVHEALIQHWQRLREWIDADREFRMWQERLRSAMRQWHTSNHDEGVLLRGAPLAEAEKWLEQNLSQEEQHFIKASLEFRDREAQEREAQQKRELELTRKAEEEQRQRVEEQAKANRKLRRRLFITTVLAVIAIAAAIGAFYSFRQANEQKEIAEQERNKAEVNAIEALNQTSKALFLAHDELGALLAGVKAGKKLKQAKLPKTSRDQTIFNLGDIVYSIQEKNRLEGHNSLVRNITFNPDGTLLASGSNDGIIKLWDMASGKEITILSGHSFGVFSVAFSPDGMLLASGSDDETIKLWNVDEGRETRTFNGYGGSVNSVAFSPDSTLLASGNYDGSINLWRVTDGLEIRTFFDHLDEVKSVAFSPDGMLLASGGNDGTIKLRKIANSQEVITLHGHSGGVESIAFSSDGTRLASGSDDGTIKLWKVDDGQEIITLRGHLDGVKDVSFNPDDALLASGSDDGTIKLWKVASGREITTLPGHSDTVYSVTFSPDGTLLASGSADNAIKLWQVAESRDIPMFKGHSGGVLSVTFNHNSALLASGSADRTIKVWQAADGQERRVLVGHVGFVWSVAFSPDGTLLASGSHEGTIKLWKVADGQEIRSLPGHADVVRSVTFSPDGTLLASGSDDGTVKLWNIIDGQKIAILHGHSNAVRSVAFSPDGMLLASGSADRTIKLWKVSDRSELATLHGHSDSVLCVTFNPDGTLLASGSADNTIKLWKVGNNKNITTFQGHSGAVFDVTFNPDGTLLASGSADSTIKFWHIADGREITTVPGHSNFVRSVIFSPDGMLLASGSLDETIKLWNVSNLCNLDLDDLLIRGCKRLRDYLKTHPSVSDEDRLLCLDEEIAIYRKQVKIEPDHENTWYNLGLALQEKGKIDEALDAFQKQVKANPDHKDAWNKSGLALQKQGRWDEALDAFQKQIEVKPDHEDAWYNMGLVLQGQDKSDEATNAFQKQAEILQKQGKWDKAVVVYQKLLDIKPNHESVLYSKGKALLELNKLEEAIDTFQKLLEITPDHESAVYHVGFALQEQDKPDEAIAAFQELLKMKPDHEDAWNMIGVALSKQNKEREAIAAFQKQIEVKSDHENAWYNMACTLWEQGRLDEALGALKKQLEVKPDHESVVQKMEDIGNHLFLNQDKLDEAITVYQKLLEIKPNHYRAWAYMGLAFWWQGKLDKVATAFADGLKVNLNNLSLLINDAQLALIQDDIPRCQTRIVRVLSLLNSKSDLFAIMLFLDWLANPEQGWENVIAAIYRLDPGVRFKHWGWIDDMTPIIERQNTETQQIARLFITFFEGEIDLPTLRARLAESERGSKEETQRTSLPDHFESP